MLLLASLSLQSFCFILQSAVKDVHEITLHVSRLVEEQGHHIGNNFGTQYSLMLTLYPTPQLPQHPLLESVLKTTSA